jgi:hypothetical protein
MIVGSATGNLPVNCLIFPTLLQKTERVKKCAQQHNLRIFHQQWESFRVGFSGL